MNGQIEFDTLHQLAEFIGELEYFGVTSKFHVESNGKGYTLTFKK
jgi:hypothetical protein